MAASALIWSSSPSMFGRPSSPLNPRANHPSSSSPLTSPTPPSSRTYQPFSIPSTFKSSSRNRPHEAPTRYVRPAKKHANHASDPFAADGTSPVENAMWKERFSRRVEERERRKKAREDELTRRRSSSLLSGMDEDEHDRQAQADDEEIFRRLMILQRRRAEHAQLVSHEVEIGRSDPMLPDFWADELERLDAEERSLAAHFDHLSPHDMSPEASRSILRDPPLHCDNPQTTNHRHVRAHSHQHPFTPGKPKLDPFNRPTPMQRRTSADDEERWAREAAEAEEAERDAEEVEIARMVEETFAVDRSTGHDEQMEMDWEAYEAMDMD